MKTVNKSVAVTPVENTSITVKVRNGVATISDKQKLIKMTVVLDSYDGNYKSGDVVYAFPDVMKHNLQVYETEEEQPRQFVLLQENLIVARG